MIRESKNAGPNQVSAWRIHRGLTQAQLAERVGTNSNMIGYLEKGERGLTAKWLRKLAQALDTTPGQLLDHAPADVESDILAIWSKIDEDNRELAMRVLRSFQS